MKASTKEKSQEELYRLCKEYLALRKLEKLEEKRKPYFLLFGVLFTLAFVWILSLL